MTEVLGRLWVELIFPLCFVTDLPRLAGVCHAFRYYVQDPRLRRMWAALAATLPGVHYAERALGLSGIQQAMARHEVIKRNCAQGTFVRGPVRRLALSDGDSRNLRIVAGRVVSFLRNGIIIRDMDTWAELATFGGFSDYRWGRMIIDDRWIMMFDLGRLFFVDCLSCTDAGTIAKVPSYTALSDRFCSGNRLCYRFLTTVYFGRIDNNGQYVHEFDLENVPYNVNIILGARGSVYALCTADAVSLFDTATRTLIKDISTPGYAQVLNRTDAYLVAEHRMFIRVRDGHVACFEANSHFEECCYVPRMNAIAMCRVNGFGSDGNCHLANADTGAIMPTLIEAVHGFRCPNVDSSGEMAWSSRTHNEIRMGIDGAIQLDHPYTVQRKDWNRPIIVFDAGVMIVSISKGRYAILRFDEKTRPRKKSRLLLK